MYSLPISILNRTSSLNTLMSTSFSSLFSPHIPSYATGQRSDMDVVVEEEVEVVIGGGTAVVVEDESVVVEVIVVVDTIVVVEVIRFVVVDEEGGGIGVVVVLDVVPAPITSIDPFLPSATMGSPPGEEQLGLLIRLYFPAGAPQLISKVIYARIPFGIGFKFESDNIPTLYRPGSTILLARVLLASSPAGPRMHCFGVK